MGLIPGQEIKITHIARELSPCAVTKTKHSHKKKKKSLTVTLTTLLIIPSPDSCVLSCPSLSFST